LLDHHFASGDIYISISASIILLVSMLAMRMETVFIKCMSIQWKDFGRYCVLGWIQIAVFTGKTALQFFFEFVHNVCHRGKALLHFLLAILIAP